MTLARSGLRSRRAIQQAPAAADGQVSLGEHCVDHDPDDQDHDEQLDQGEATLARAFWVSSIYHEGSVLTIDGRVLVL